MCQGVGVAHAPIKRILAAGILLSGVAYSATEAFARPGGDDETLTRPSMDFLGGQPATILKEDDRESFDRDPLWDAAGAGLSPDQKVQSNDDPLAPEAAAVAADPLGDAVQPAKRVVPVTATPLADHEKVEIKTADWDAVDTRSIVPATVETAVPKTRSDDPLSAEFAEPDDKTVRLADGYMADHDPIALRTLDWDAVDLSAVVPKRRAPETAGTAAEPDGYDFAPVAVSHNPLNAGKGATPAVEQAVRPDRQPRAVAGGSLADHVTIVNLAIDPDTVDIASIVPRPAAIDRVAQADAGEPPAAGPVTRVSAQFKLGGHSPAYLGDHGIELLTAIRSESIDVAAIVPGRPVSVAVARAEPPAPIPADPYRTSADTTSLATEDGVVKLFDDDVETAALLGDLDVKVSASDAQAEPALSDIVVAYKYETAPWERVDMLAASLPAASKLDVVAENAPDIVRIARGGAGLEDADGTLPTQIAGLGNLRRDRSSELAVATAADLMVTPATSTGSGFAMASAADVISERSPIEEPEIVPAMTVAARTDIDKQAADVVIQPAASSLLGDLGHMAIPKTQTLRGRVTIRDAISIALSTNPEINEASANREAIEFELRQGRGFYLPSVDVEARAGAQVVDRPSTRTNGDDDHVFGPVEGRITITQLLFDGFNREAEIDRQASRVDDASFRVEERSEAIALNIIRAHLDIHRLNEILRLARANLEYHRAVLEEISQGASAGAISVADREQAEDRILAAETFIIESREQLEAARIGFFRLVGRFPGTVDFAPSVAAKLPKGLDKAIAVGRANNPLIKIADAAISTAYAELRQSRSSYFPTINLELIGRAGEDLDGVRGRDADIQALIRMNWNLYAGGVRPAGVQSSIRVLDEQRQRLHLAQRQVEEEVRTSWNSLDKQRMRLRERSEQLRVAEKLLGSYREQFKIGQRSLLDVLDTQNTRFNTQVAVVTSRHAVRFAEYRILASAGILLENIGFTEPETAMPYAREAARVPEVPPAEEFTRTDPRQ